MPYENGFPTLQELEANERFQALPYPKQLEARNNWLRSAASDGPLVGAPPEMLAEAGRRVATRRPTSGLAATEMSPVQQRLYSLADQLQAGDVQAGDLAVMEVVTNSANMHLNLARRIISGVARTVGKLGLVDEEVALQGQFDRSLATTPADKDALEYLKQQVVMMRPDLRQAVSRAETVGTIGGFMTEFLTDRTIGRGFGTAMIGQGARGSKLAGGVVSKGWDHRIKSSLGRWFYGSTIKEMVESGMDATFLTASQLANDHVNERLYQDGDVSQKVGRMALSFGENFAADMVAFGLMSLGGKFLRSAGRVFTKGYGKGPVTEYTDDQLRKVMDGLITGETVPEEVIANASKSARDRFFRFRTRAKWETAGTSFLQEEQVGELVLARNGYDLEVADGKYTLWSLRKGDGSVQKLGTWDSFDSAWTRAFQDSEEMQAAAMAKEGAGVQLVGSGDVALREVLRAQTPGDVVVRPTQWAKMLTPELGNGKVTAPNVKATAQSMAHQMGVPREVGRQLDVRQVSDWGTRVKQGRTRVGDVVFVPERVPTRRLEQRYVRRFLQDVKEWAGERGARGANDWDPEQWFTGQYQKAQRESVGLSREWIRYQVETTQPQGTAIRRAADGVSLVYPDGRQVKYATMDELGSALYRSTVDLNPAEVGQHLKRNFGLELRPPKTGEPSSHWTVRTQGGEILEQAGDLDTLLSRNPNWTPKAPIEQAPMLEIDPTTSDLVFERNLVRGPAEQVLELGRAYKSRMMSAADQFVKAVEKEGVDVYYRGVNRKYVLAAEQFGLTKEFDSLEAALRWVGKQRNNYVDLADVAAEKGMKVYPFRGQYVVQSIDGSNKAFASISDVKAYLRQRPQLAGFEKELSGADEALIAKLQQEGLEVPSGEPRGVWNDYDLENTFEKWGEAEGVVKDSGRTYFGLAGRPPDAVLQQLGADLGVPELYSRFYEPMEKAITSYKGMSNTFDDIINRIFKGVKAHEAELLTELWELPEAGWADRAAEIGLDLTEDHRRALRQSRLFLNEELGRLFGVDGYKLLNNYLPHIRAWAHNPTHNVDPNQFGDGILKTILKADKLPDDIHAFMKHFRTQDMLALGTERNLKRILRVYAHKGSKVLTMNDQYQRAKQWVNRAKESGLLNEAALTYATEYLEDVMGMTKDSSLMAARQWSVKMGEHFYNWLQKSRLVPASVKAKVQVQDMFSVMQGLTVGATMSFKGWMPLRNMQQIWTMLAPRLGPGGGRVILEAFDRVNKNGDDIARHLRSTGRLTGEIPVFGYKSEGLLGFFNRKGMQIHKNSDDFNRMITDQSVDIMMEDAAKRLLRGSINEKQFLELSGLRRLNEQSAHLVSQTLEQKGYMAAKDLYGDILTRETQALYREGAAPALFRKSQFGKLFGMFGQYPTYYLENLRRGLSNGTVMDRAGFVGLTALYSAGLWTLFEKGLGISANDFTPRGQMFFTGGPYFDLLMNLKKAAAGDWDAPRADQLLREGRRLFTPGSSAGKAIQDGVKFWQAGDTYNALLRFGAIPVVAEQP